MPHARPPIDTMRLDPREKRQLIDQLNQQGQAQRDGFERRGIRVAFRATRALVAVEHPDHSVVHYAVVPRNLSRRGMAFVHGRFIYPESPCTVLLPTLEGQWRTIAGRILRCRHVGGVVHEVSVLFDQAVDLTAFVELSAAERVRHQEELDEAAAPRREAVGRALVVDADKLERQQFAHWLGRLGLDVAEAVGLTQAVRRLRSQTYDLVVLEVDGPGATGLELARMLRASGYCGPVLAIAAQDTAAVEREALAAGCTRFLAKPCEPERLQETVTRLLSMRFADGEAPQRSTLADDPRVRPHIDAFVAGLNDRLAQVRQAYRDDDLLTLAVSCRELQARAKALGFELLTDTARTVLALLESRPLNRHALHRAVDDLVRLLRQTRAA